MNNDTKGQPVLFQNFRAGLNSKPNLVPISEKIDKFITNKNKDYYTSLYKYNDSHKTILEEKGTLSGITDTVTNTLYFDFDSKDDIDKARNDALIVAERLLDEGFPEESIGVYFTGNKGFSLEITIDSYIVPNHFKALTMALTFSS